MPPHARDTGISRRSWLLAGLALPLFPARAASELSVVYESDPLRGDILRPVVQNLHFLTGKPLERLKDAERVARALLKEPEVLPVGLGARDSLRLEAGLCLYGHDMDETTDPVEANLVWAIGKRRRLDKDFPAAAKIVDEISSGTARKRVGILPEGRAPARDGSEIADKSGRIIGRITSGGFGPSLNAPVAMGYVETEFAADGTEIDLLVRGRRLPARVAPMPFVPHGYKRAK